MSDTLTTLFKSFDAGLISRRRLLQALGIAAIARPVSTFAQGSCGGARAGTPECDTTPAKVPFEPTGWKTVFMDHFTLQCANYQREAAYYASLMNWKIRSDDGTKAILDIGDDVGAVIIRGGYQPPAPAPQAAPTAQPPAGGGAGQAGGGRGGNAGRGPRMAVWDSFCWGIEPWDAKKVEAELKKRGLNPVADKQGRDFESFHVKDPNGFDLQISNGNRRNRRQGAPAGKMTGPAPFEPTNWKTVWLDHISFQCTNYKETVAFYNALLGWKLGRDTGRQNQCEIGDVGDTIIRLGGGGGRGQAAADAPPPPRRARIDHISFGIQPFDPDAVKAELEKRGLDARVDTGSGGDIHTSPFKSYHTHTPSGFDLQISNVTKATRSAGAGPGLDEEA